MRRFTQLTKGISKKIQHHWYAMAQYMTWYNFCQPHGSLGNLTTPAMAAGLAEWPLEVDFLIEGVEERELEAVRAAASQPRQRRRVRRRNPT